MKLKNSTDIPDEKIREIVNFVRPEGVRNVDIFVENRTVGAGSGRASGAGYITVKVQPHARYPLHWNNTWRNEGYCFEGWLLNKDELLVMLFAHEFRHQWQFGRGQSQKEGQRRYQLRLSRRTNRRVRRRGQKGGAERDADIYAKKMLRKWRRAHRPEPDWSAADMIGRLP